MSNVRTFTRSFNGGELTQEFWGQIGDQKFQTGLALCSNFEVLPHGPVRNRAGFGYVLAAKASATKARLIPFTFSTTQTFVIETGVGYFRFHTLGATLRTDGTVEGFASVKAPYEVAHTYADADLMGLHFVQSADVLTIVHPNYPPAELRRLGAASWALTTISFASTLIPPSGISVNALVGSGATLYTYKVAAVGPDGRQQSLASLSASNTNNLLTSGNINRVTWGAVTGATRYRVYKQSNGLFGYIGQTDALQFDDDNIAADISNTPPEANNPFSGAGNYPGAVSYFEQRRCFAGSINAPQNLWMTRSGTESDLTYSIPTRDDDAVQVRVAAREANTVRHLVPMASLMLMTSAAEWRLTNINSDAITPSSVSVKPQSYIGANNVQPVLVNNTLLFAAARGGHMRELAYNWQAQGFITGDLSLRAPHLFDGFDIIDMAYQKAPHPMLWAVSSSGKLLGLTYVPEQQIGAWHQHSTDGVFESIAVVAESSEDYLYAVVRRTVGGLPVRYIERKRSRFFASQADQFIVDAGATYTGPSTTTINGLTWLEGKTVNVLADGAVQAAKTVNGGSITLDQEASTVQVGLPITADLQTLPMAFETMAFGQGRQKNVNRVWLRVVQSGGIFAGPTFDQLREFKQRTTEPYGSPPNLISNEVQIDLMPSWQAGGQVCIRQTAPLALTITSMTIEAAVGG